MGLLRRTFRGYQSGESRESYRTAEFQGLWKLPVWPVATYPVSLEQPEQRRASSSEDRKMTRVGMDGIPAAHGLLFAPLVEMLVVFTGALAVGAATEGLFRP